MKRQFTMPLGVVWLTTIVAAWLVTTPLLAVLIKVTGYHDSLGGLVGLAALSATFACVVVGGSVTAVALRVRRKHSQRRAVLSGLAIGVVVLLFFYSYVAAAGTPVQGAWKALPPLVIVTAAELALGLRLRRYCRSADTAEAPPSQSPPDQPEASALPANRDRAGASSGRSDPLARERPVSERGARARSLSVPAAWRSPSP